VDRETEHYLQQKEQLSGLIKALYCVEETEEYLLSHMDKKTPAEVECVVSALNMVKTVLGVEVRLGRYADKHY